MIGKRISPDKDLEYLLGNTDSKGRDRTSEVVGGGKLEGNNAHEKIRPKV